MDLIERSISGTLDPLAACKLLWSGAITFKKEQVTWDGHAHCISTPTINDDVIAFYAVSHEDVAAVVPDLLRMLETLEKDVELRVPPQAIADAVSNSLLWPNLTGATLFLLQSGTHPLIVETTNPTTLRIRYDQKLARGIPNLQNLLVRLACHLRLFAKDQRPFAIDFVPNDRRGPSVIQDFKGCVPDGAMHLDEHVKALDPRVVLSLHQQTESSMGSANNTAIAALDQESSTEDVANHADSPRPEAEQLKAACMLESGIYTIHALLNSTQSRVLHLENDLKRTEQTQPRAEPYMAPSSASFGLPSSAHAARSLAIRSALYIGIGIVILLLGRMCVLKNQELSCWLMGYVNKAFEIAGDFTGLILGQFNQVGTHSTFGFPPDSLAGVIRIVGFALMGLGILFPVRKILTRNRKLKRELSYSKSHESLLADLAQKQRISAQAAYAHDLDTWATHLKALEEDIDYAKRAVNKLEDTSTTLKTALCNCYSPSPIPQNMQNLASVCTLADYLDSEKSATLDGESGVIARFEDDLAAARIGLDPNEATDLQPTLRATSRTTRNLLQGIETASTEEKRYAIVDEYCDKIVSASIDCAK